MAISPKLSVNRKTFLATVFISMFLFSALAVLQFVKIVRAGTIIVPDDYSTTQDAITAAKEGDTIFVKKGTYEGPINQTLVINKTISLVGENANNTKISLHPPLVPMSIFTYTYMGYSNPIKIEANDVKLSGFTINTPGGAISITGDRIQIIGNNATTGLTVNGSNATIADNTLTGGISASGSYHIIAQNIVGDIYCSGSYNSITENSIMGSSTDGLVYLAGPFNIVYGNTINGNANGWVGVNVRSDGNIIAKNNITNCAGAGIETEHGQNIIIYANRITNGYAGFSLAGNNVTVYANYVANNNYGISIAIGGQKTVYHNNFIDNNNQVGFGRGYETAIWDNDKEGNYWNDYTGADWNLDGIGDTPYVINENNQDHYPLMAPFDISSVSVQLPDWTYPSPSPTPTATPPNQQLGPEPFPTTLVAAAAVSVAVVGICLFVYIRKRKH